VVFCCTNNAGKANRHEARVGLLLTGRGKSLTNLLLIGLLVLLGWFLPELFVLVLGMAITGAFLPWDQAANWTAVVVNVPNIHPSLSTAPVKG